MGDELFFSGAPRPMGRLNYIMNSRAEYSRHGASGDRRFTPGAQGDRQMAVPVRSEASADSRPKSSFRNLSFTVSDIVGNGGSSERRPILHNIITGIGRLDARDCRPDGEQAKSTLAGR